MCIHQGGIPMYRQGSPTWTIIIFLLHKLYFFQKRYNKGISKTKRSITCMILNIQSFLQHVLNRIWQLYLSLNHFYPLSKGIVSRLVTVWCLLVHSRKLYFYYKICQNADGRTVDRYKKQVKIYQSDKPTYIYLLFQRRYM